jgi:coenzyme F420-reducing hydrogenase delta subunit/ferredoxin
MCSGRVDLGYLLRGFYNGIDGIYIAACRLDECNYITHGNYHALNMVLLCKRILEYIGLNPERLRIEFMNSSEGSLFAETVSAFTQRIRQIGPLEESERLERNELARRIKEFMKLIPYIKMAKKDKLSSRIKDHREWDRLFQLDEIEKLLEEIPSYYIDPERCQACMICARRCPADAILSGRDLIHIIDQERCIKCGTCIEVCPSRFGAVKKIVGGDVPPPLPEKERKIVRREKGVGFSF